MSPHQVLVADLVAASLVLCLVVLALRGWLGAARTFALYVAFALVTNRLVVWWPETFFRRPYWAWQVGTSTLLELLVVLEVVSVAFARWPFARRLVHAAATIAIAGATATAIVASRAPDRLLAVFAWLEAGVTWAFVALLAVAGWYRLPLHPLHRSICLGFVLYLGLYAAVLDLLARGPNRELITALDPAAFAATVGIWTLAVLRAEVPTGQGRILYPWAARS